MDAATGVRDSDSFGMTVGGALNFMHHLSEIEFGDDEGFDYRGKFFNALFGEWPAGDEAKLADFHSLRPRELDATLSDARGDAVGDYDDIGVLDLFFFEKRDAVGGVTNFALQAPHQLVLSLRRHIRVAVLVVREAGHVEVVALASVRHLRNLAAIGAVGQIVLD